MAGMQESETGPRKVKIKVGSTLSSDISHPTVPARLIRPDSLRGNGRTDTPRRETIRQVAGSARTQRNPYASTKKASDSN